MEILLRKIELMIIFYLKQKKYVKRKQQFQTEYVSEFKGVIRKWSKGADHVFCNICKRNITTGMSLTFHRMFNLQHKKHAATSAQLEN